MEEVTRNHKSALQTVSQSVSSLSGNVSNINACCHFLKRLKTIYGSQKERSEGIKPNVIFLSQFQKNLIGLWNPLSELFRPSPNCSLKIFYEKL